VSDATSEQSNARQGGTESSPPLEPSAPIPGRTRIGVFWVAVVVSLVVLVLLIVFILENGRHAVVSYASLPLGVALLIAAVVGGVVVACAGVARLLQVRTRVRRATRRSAVTGPR
jgi:uncharacterized integral membrane protein